jgi:type VI protein secretion system component Hcp
VSGVSYQKTEVRLQKTDEEMQDEATFLSSVIRLLTPDTRHLKPILLKKKIDKNDPYLANYLRDATLGREFKRCRQKHLAAQPDIL